MTFQRAKKNGLRAVFSFEAHHGPSMTCATLPIAFFNDSTVERTHRANDSMSNIQLDIEWTEAASRKIEKLMPRNANKDAYLALPPVECLPMEGDVLFLGPDGKQQPFIVAERQYHHEGDADWTIILILDVPHDTH